MARLFVSIELPALVRAEMNRLQCDVPGARWAPVEQLHLTLRFIGELDGLARRDAEAALDEVEAAPFELLLAGVGHFPPRGQPRVLWVGVEPSPALLELHERICRALGRAGLPAEARNFYPHITLARLRDTPPRAVAAFVMQHNLFRAGPIPVDSFHLYSSRLGARGAVHTPETSWPLD